MSNKLIQAAKHGTLEFLDTCMRDVQTGQRFGYSQYLNTYLEILPYLGVKSMVDLVRTLDRLGHIGLAEGIDRHLSTQSENEPETVFLRMNEQELLFQLRSFEELQEFETCAYIRDLLVLRFPKYINNSHKIEKV